MDRKQFLLKSAHTCLACCSAVAGFGSVLPQHITGDDKLSSDLGKRMVNGAKSPDWRRAEKSLSWIRNMLDVMDEHLDDESKIKL